MMKRLTDKKSDYYKFRYDACLTKLCDLEDIEEELGIDLITLVTALTDGIYTKHNNFIDYIFPQYLRFTEDSLISSTTELAGTENDDTMEWRYKDYGKSWALAKKEIENEKF